MLINQCACAYQPVCLCLSTSVPVLINQCACAYQPVCLCLSTSVPVLVNQYVCAYQPVGSHLGRLASLKVIHLRQSHLVTVSQFSSQIFVSVGVVQIHRSIQSIHHEVWHYVARLWLVGHWIALLSQTEWSECDQTFPIREGGGTCRRMNDLGGQWTALLIPTPQNEDTPVNQDTWSCDAPWVCGIERNVQEAN